MKQLRGFIMDMAKDRHHAGELECVVGMLILFAVLAATIPFTALLDEEY